MSLEMKYFVLKPRAKHPNDMFARASQKAMETYANYLRSQYVELDLATSLIRWAGNEHIRQLGLGYEEDSP